MPRSASGELWSVILVVNKLLVTGTIAVIVGMRFAKAAGLPVTTVNGPAAIPAFAVASAVKKVAVPNV